MGKRRRKLKLSNDLYVYGFLIMIVFFIAIAAYPTVVGLDVSIGNTLTRLFPTLLLSCMAIYMLMRNDKEGQFGGAIFLGLAVCRLLTQLDTEALITVDMYMGLTLVKLQVLTMVISILVGAYMYAK